MISRYVVFEQGVAERDPDNYMGEFARLETAIDFAQLFRAKHPEMKLEIRGIAYNRTDFTIGKVLTSWGELPEAYRDDENMAFEDAAGEILKTALRDEKTDDFGEKEPAQKRRTIRRRRK